MTVEFRVLGDIEARIGDRPVEVGHARQRCVLAALLVEANQAVPADKLLDRVWADRPPHRARNVLSGYVSRLRQVLTVTDEVRISRQPGGYVLVTDPLAVDLHRFRRLIAQARTADQIEDAAALLTEALALWRGEAFATLDTPWLNSVRDTLDGERLAAQLERNDLGLLAGQHAELLGELSAQAKLHPLDERLAGQLMLALYRCGRQAEALTAYQDIRTLLVEELGADPGAPLRDLHQQILTGDPAVDAPPAGRRAGRRSITPLVPRQLPPPPRSFTGRARELAQLDALLSAATERPSAVVISALSGTAGVGKTALALHWAHKIADQFEDGQLYINLRGFDPSESAMTPAEAVRSLLEAIDVHPQRIPPGLDAQVGLYRSLLAGRRMLLVLDNARDVAQLRPLLPGTPECLVLITSRNQLAGLVVADGATPFSLALLQRDDAQALLVKRLGAERVAAEHQAAEDIITMCAGLPLALAIVAARAAIQSDLALATLAAQLLETRDRLDAFDVGDASVDVRAVFSWSYQSLSAQASWLFRLLGIHPGAEIGAASAASLMGCPPHEVTTALTELVQANLLTEIASGRYTSHDLLRTYARELAAVHDVEADRRAAIHRVLDYYLHTAENGDRFLYPHRDPIDLPERQPGVTTEELFDQRQAMSWFAIEAPALLAAVRMASQNGFERYAWLLTLTMMNFLSRRGYTPDWIAAQHAALEAASRLGDRRGQALAHLGLGQSHFLLGRYDDAQAHAQQAVSGFDALQDRARQALAHLHVGGVLTTQGLHVEALGQFHNALSLYEGIDHQAGQANALNNLGWTHAQLGEYEEAITHCDRALALMREIGDRYGQAPTLDSLGYAYHRVGDPQQAVISYQKALELFREHGDQYLEAETLTRLGDAQQDVGDDALARKTWQAALDLFEELGHPGIEDVRIKLENIDST